MVEVKIEAGGKKCLDSKLERRGRENYREKAKRNVSTHSYRLTSICLWQDFLSNLFELFIRIERKTVFKVTTTKRKGAFLIQ